MSTERNLTGPVALRDLWVPLDALLRGQPLTPEETGAARRAVDEARDITNAAWADAEARKGTEQEADLRLRVETCMKRWTNLFTFIDSKLATQAAQFIGVCYVFLNAGPWTGPAVSSMLLRLAPWEEGAEKLTALLGAKEAP